MNRLRSPRPDTRSALVILAALAIALGSAGLGPVWASERTASDLEASTELTDWFAEMEARYEANPELKTTKGSEM